MSAKKKAATKKTKAVKTKAAKKPASRLAKKRNLQAEFDKAVVSASKKVLKVSASTKAKSKKSSADTLGGLTSVERAHLADLIDQGRAPVVAESTGKLAVVFYVQDGVDRGDGTRKERRQPAFTVAMVAVGGELKGVGVAKLNPKDDEWDNERGRLIALARAVRGEAKLQ